MCDIYNIVSEFYETRLPMVLSYLNFTSNSYLIISNPILTAVIIIAATIKQKLIL